MLVEINSFFYLYIQLVLFLKHLQNKIKISDIIHYIRFLYKIVEDSATIINILLNI